MAEKVILVDESGTPISVNVKKAVSVVPSDETEVAYKSLYIGTKGDLLVILSGDDHVTPYVNAEGWFPISVKKVMASTTADDIIGHLE